MPTGRENGVEQTRPSLASFFEQRALRQGQGRGRGRGRGKDSSLRSLVHSRQLARVVVAGRARGKEALGEEAHTLSGSSASHNPQEDLAYNKEKEELSWMLARLESRCLLTPGCIKPLLLLLTGNPKPVFDFTDYIGEQPRVDERSLKLIDNAASSEDPINRLEVVLSAITQDIENIYQAAGKPSSGPIHDWRHYWNTRVQSDTLGIVKLKPLFLLKDLLTPLEHSLLKQLQLYTRPKKLATQQALDVQCQEILTLGLPGFLHLPPDNFQYDHSSATDLGSRRHQLLMLCMLGALAGEEGAKLLTTFIYERTRVTLSRLTVMASLIGRPLGGVHWKKKILDDMWVALEGKTRNEVSDPEKDTAEEVEYGKGHGGSHFIFKNWVMQHLQEMVSKMPQAQWLALIDVLMTKLQKAEEGQLEAFIQDCIVGAKRNNEDKSGFKDWPERQEALLLLLNVKLRECQERQSAETVIQRTCRGRLARHAIEQMQALARGHLARKSTKALRQSARGGVHSEPAVSQQSQRGSETQGSGTRQNGVAKGVRCDNVVPSEKVKTSSMHPMLVPCGALGAGMQAMLVYVQYASWFPLANMPIVLAGVSLVIALVVAKLLLPTYHNLDSAKKAHPLWLWCLLCVGLQPMLLLIPGVAMMPVSILMVLSSSIAASAIVALFIARCTVQDTPVVLGQPVFKKQESRPVRASRLFRIRRNLGPAARNAGLKVTGCRADTSSFDLSP